MGGIFAPGIHDTEPPQPHVDIPGLSQTKDTGPEIPQAPTDTWTFTSNKDGTFSFTKDPPLKPTEVIKQIQESRKNMNHDRVVRIMNIYKKNGNYFYGTGYILDDGLVLTAAHVVDDNPDIRVLMFSDYQQRIDPGVVYLDKERDLAIVQYETSEDKFEPTKIGTYQEGEPLTVMTLNPEDTRYEKGKETQEVLAGRGADLSQYNAVNRMHGPEYASLQEQIRKIDYDLSVANQNIRALWETNDPSILERFEPAEPYVKQKLSSDFITPPEIDNKIDVPSGKGGVAKMMIPSTSYNKTIPGMSGSAYFDKEGRLVGVAGPSIKMSVSGLGLGQVSVQRVIPDEIATELKILESQRDLLQRKRNGLSSQAQEVAEQILSISSVLLPKLGANDLFVPSQAIVPFLESAMQKVQK